MAKRIQIIDDITGKVSFDETADLDALVTGGGDMVSANNLSDLANVSTARTNLGVDAAGTDNAPDASTTVKGKVEKSTSAENVAGTSDVVYPTVAGTKEMIDTHPGGTANPQFVQVTRTTAYELTTTPTAITFDSSDIESDTAVIDHDGTNTERVILKEDVYFEGTVDFQFENLYNNSRVATIELYKNNVTLLNSIDVAFEGTTHQTIHRALVIPPALFAVNDYLSIKISIDSIAGGGGTPELNLMPGARVIIKKMK